MKIEAVEAIPLKVPYRDPAFAPTAKGQARRAHPMVLVKVTTDDGFVGYGETFTHIMPVQRALVALIEDAVAPLAVGSDAADISGLSHRLSSQLVPFGRGGIASNALGAFEIALWDIAGRRCAQPLHRLLGGARKTEIPCIAAFNHYFDAGAIAEAAKEAVHRGYRRIKIHERDIDVIQAARVAMGPDVRMMVDINCSWDIEHALQVLPALSECNPYWLEDPIWPPENFEALRKLKKRFAIPLAAGADASTVWRFKEILDADVIAFAQPDICTVGGIIEFGRVATLCALKGVTVAPHSPFQGPSMLATLHLLATISDDSAYSCNFVDYDSGMFGNAVMPNRGVLQVPQGPGLGFEPSEDFLQKYRMHPSKS